MRWKKILKSIFPEEGETTEEYLQRTGGSKNIVFPQRERGFKNRPQKIKPELQREMKFIQDLDAFKNLIQSEFAYTVSDYTLPNIGNKFIQILDSAPELENFVYHTTKKPNFEDLNLSYYLNNIFKIAKANDMNAVIDNRTTRKNPIKNIEKLDSIYDLSKKGYGMSPANDYLGAIADNMEFEDYCRVLENMFKIFIPELSVKLSGGDEAYDLRYTCNVILSVIGGIEKYKKEPINFLAEIIEETVQEQLRRTTDIYLAHYMCEFYIPNEMPQEGNVGELYRIIFRTKEDMMGLIKSYMDLFNTVGEKIQVVKVVKFIAPKVRELKETDFTNYASRSIAKALFKKYFEGEMVDPVVDEEKRRIKSGYMTRSSIDTPEWFNEIRDILMVDSVDDFTRDLYEYLQDNMVFSYQPDTYGDFKQYVIHSLFTSIRSKDDLKMDNNDYKTYLWTTLEGIFKDTAEDYIDEHLFHTYGADEEISEEEATEKEVLVTGADMFIDYFFSNMNNFPAEDADMEALISYMNKNPSGIDMLEGERGDSPNKDYRRRMRRTRRDELTPEEGKRNIEDVLRERGRR
jgi:hypothetical protein